MFMNTPGHNGMKIVLCNVNLGQKNQYETLKIINFVNKRNRADFFLMTNF